MAQTPSAVTRDQAGSTANYHKLRKAFTTTSQGNSTTLNDAVDLYLGLHIAYSSSSSASKLIRQNIVFNLNTSIYLATERQGTEILTDEVLAEEVWAVENETDSPIAPTHIAPACPHIKESGPQINTAHENPKNPLWSTVFHSFIAGITSKTPCRQARCRIPPTAKQTNKHTCGDSVSNVVDRTLLPAAPDPEHTSQHSKHLLFNFLLMKPLHHLSIDP